MEIILLRKVDKFLDKFTKLQGYESLWRWRVGNYRIIGEVRTSELIIKIIEINTRENVYKDYQ